MAHLTTTIVVLVMLIWTVRNTFSMMQCVATGAAQAAGVVRVARSTGWVTCITVALTGVEARPTVRNTESVLQQMGGV